MAAQSQESHGESLERAVGAVADAVRLAEAHRPVVAAGAGRVRLVVVRNRLNTHREGHPGSGQAERDLLAGYTEQASSAESLDSFCLLLTPSPQQSKLKAAGGLPGRR